MHKKSSLCYNWKTGADNPLRNTRWAENKDFIQSRESLHRIFESVTL